MTESFEAWELSARLALADLGVGYHAAAPLIEQARAHCEATGQSPREAFGSPGEFAAAAAAEQPAEAREEVDRHGLTVTDHLTGQLVYFAVLALIASIFFAILERTLSFPVAPAHLAGTALLLLGMMAAGGLPGALRAAGRPRLVPFAFLAAGVLAVLSATAFTTMSREPVGRLPVLILVALSVIAIGLLTRAPKPPTRPAEPIGSSSDGGSSGSSSSSGSSGRAADRSDTPADREAWLRRLDGLLVGRYDLPPGRAADLVREARAHLDATGAAPRDEFGPLAAYARSLAEVEPIRRDPWWRTAPAAMVAQALGVAAGVDVFVGWWADGHVWAACLVAVPVTLAVLSLLINTGRAHFRAGRTA